MKQFEGTDSESVEPYVSVLLDVSQRGNVSHVGVLRLFEILHDGTGGHDTALDMLHTKAFEVFGAEVLEQFLSCGGFAEDPVVHFENDMLGAEVAFEVLFVCPIVEHFFGSKTAEEFFYVVERALPREELTGRDVEESHAASGFAEVDGGEEVVFFIVEHVIAHGYARGDEFGNAPLDESFGEFGVFQLVADGHTSSCPNQFRQISVQGVVGKSCHFGDIAATTVIPLGKGDAENARRDDGIFTIGLVEVAATKQQQGIGMLCLEAEELFHHGGKPLVFCHLF